MEDGSKKHQEYSTAERILTATRQPRPIRPGLLVPALFALAIGFRFWRYLTSDLARDAAITGVQSLGILRGEFPLFFLGQKFMGTPDSYLAAPLYLLFGPSTLTANLPPVLFSLGTVWITWLLLRRLLGVSGHLLGLLYLAVPTSLGFFCLTEGKSIYLLPLLFSALLLWITLKIETADRGDSSRLFLVWGLLAGLAFWINFLSGVVIGACLIFVMLGLSKRTLPRALGWGSLGGIIGLLPLLCFYLYHGLPWLGVVKPGTTFTIADRLAAIFFNAWPIVLGINPADNRVGLPPGSSAFFVYVLLNGLLLAAVVGMGWEARKSERRELLLPLFILLFNGAAALAGGRPNDYWGQDQRYFLAVYLALPFCWGWLAERWNQQRLFVGALAVLLLTVHLTGYGTFKGRPLIKGPTSGFFFTHEGALKQEAERLRDRGFRHVYDRGDFDLPFLSGGDPVLATATTPEDTLAMARVNAAFRPAFRMPLESSFRLLGVTWRNSGGIIHDYSEPLGADALLDPARWRAATLDGQSLGKALFDGDLFTGFNTAGNNPDGQGFILDLGREESVGGLALIPENFLQVPGGLKIETAGGNGTFQTIREIRGYVGPFYQSGPHPFFMVRYPRVEGYFDPRAVRYIRLTQRGNIREDWPIKEILVFGPRPGSPGLPWPEAARRLVATIRGQGLHSLYADAWPSSLLYATPFRGKPRLLLPNHHSDPYGSLDPDPHLPLILDPSPGNGLLVLHRDLPRVVERLSRSGLVFDPVDAGRYTLLKFMSRKEGASIIPGKIFSEVNPGEAGALVKGLPPGKRWSSAAPQKPGTGLTLDLGRPETVEWVTLDSPRFPRDYPRGLKAFTSPDGKAWTPAPIELTEPLAFTGQVLLLTRGPTQRYRLIPAVKTRFLRLEPAAFDPTYWWSVEKIGLNGPAEK